MSRLFLTYLLFLLCATSLLAVGRVDSTQILAVKSEGQGDVLNSSLVGITFDENGFLEQEDVLFAGESKHRMAFPSTNANSQQILLAYSPNADGLFPPTMIYTGSSTNSTFERLTTNDPNNITEGQAVLSNDGQQVFYSASMGDSWYGNNVSDTSRLAVSDNSGGNYEWMFFENIPFNWMFNQWCPALDASQNNILYFLSDLCDPVTPCLYAVDLEQTNSKGEFTAQMVLSQVASVGCPHPYADENGSGLILGQPSSKKENSPTAIGTFDYSSQKFTPLFVVPQVTTNSATEVDQFFECAAAQAGKTHVCVHALGRSLVTVDWDGFGILTRIVTGNFDIGTTSLNERITAYTDPWRVLDA